MLGHKHIATREGGIEVVVAELSARMVQRGHTVISYERKSHHVAGKTYDIASLKEYHGVKIRPVFTIDRAGIAAFTSSVFGTIAAVLDRPDVIHYHAEGPCAMLWLPHLLGIRTVATIHGLDWAREKWHGNLGSKYIHFGEKVAVRYADKIIVLSDNLKSYFMDTYGRNTYFIPNGVSKPIKKEAKQIIEKWQIGGSNSSYFLQLSRLTPEKGIQYLIKAFKKVKTDKKLVIAGGSGDSSGYINELKDLAADDGRIVFTGFVQGQLLEELYSNAYVYCLPSDLEGMPLSLLEAMSYGNCCLTSDIPECAEVLEDKGLTFAHSNIEALREKIQYLAEHTEIVERYRRDAAEFILQKYSWDDVTEKTLDLYML